MAGCKITSQVYMIAIGLIFWGISASFIYMGTWVFQTYGHFKEVTSSTYTLVPAIISICIGAIMFVAGILGCCGAFSKNRCLLATFFMFVLVVLTFEVAASVLGYVYRANVKDTIQHGMNDAMNNYANDTSVHHEVDYIQKQLECCGSHNYTDWMATPWGLSHKGFVPESCCIVNSADNCTGNITGTNLTDINTQGCYDKTTELFEDHLALVAGVAVAFAIIHILGMIATCVLFWQKRQSVPYGNLSGSGYSV